jgi:hypothetical protein
MGTGVKPFGGCCIVYIYAPGGQGDILRASMLVTVACRAAVMEVYSQHVHAVLSLSPEYAGRRVYWLKVIEACGSRYLLRSL